LGASALVGISRSARAEQFVLVDATFDYTWDDASNSKPSKSHYYVNDKNFLNTARPKNWVTPVDYRNGKVHTRVEVFKKPAGDQQVGWTLCYIANQGEYGCADSTYYKSTGVFDNETKMTDFWQNEKIVWDQGIKQMDLIYAIDDSGSGHVTNHADLKDLTTPTRVRITMVQVSAGATYDPSIIEGTGGYGGAGGAGGGSAGGAGGLGGTSMLGGSSSGGAPSSGGSASGGYGGLLGMGGSGGASAGTPPSVAGTSASSAGSTNSGSGGSGAPPSNADTSSSAGCALAPAKPTRQLYSGGLALLAALGLFRRTRRLLRR
jgi:hypothetical protein